MALKNCIYCGRDTRSEHGICYRCQGKSRGFRNREQINDTKDRHILDIPFPDDDNHEYVEFDTTGDKESARFLEKTNKKERMKE